MSHRLDWLELELDYCSLTYGVAPCQARLGVTGQHRCFNGCATCQDRQNFDPEPFWLRFSEPTSELPRLQEFDGEGLPHWLPLIQGISHSPVRPDPGVSIEVRAELRVTLQDAPYHDIGLDKYAHERGFDASRRSTFFLKLLTRFPHYVGRRLRWHRGFIGGEFVTREYIVEKVEGPDQNNRVTIIAKDPLKLLDAERAQAPRPSQGQLVADLAEEANPSTLDVETPDLSEYDLTAKGWRRLDGIVGGAAVSSNALALLDTATSGTAYVVADDFGTPDHYARCARQQTDARNYFEVAVRVLDADNFIGLRFTGSPTPEWEIVRSVDGAHTVIGSSESPAPEVGDVMRLEAEGDQIRAFVNDDLIIGPITETALQDVTHVGLVARVHSADPALDDFEAGTMVSGVRETRFTDSFTRADEALEGLGIVLIGKEGVQYTSTTIVDDVTVRLNGVTRGLPDGYETERRSHSEGDRVQLALYYRDETLPGIVQDLLTNYVPRFDASGRVAKLVEIGRRGSEGMVGPIRRRGQGRRVSARGWASRRPGAW